MGHGFHSYLGKTVSSRVKSGCFQDPGALRKAQKTTSLRQRKHPANIHGMLRRAQPF